jgi:hypothetical protein
MKLFAPMRRIFLLIMGTFLITSGYSQKTADIGIWGGAAGYDGDLENVTFNQFTFPTLGAYFRYNFHERVGARLMFLTGRTTATGIIQSHEWTFDKGVQDLTAQFEINYLRYAIGNRKAAFSTYLTGGLGMMLYRYEYDPALLALINPAHNKGPDPVQQNVLAPTLPFGMGFKFNIGSRIGIGMEYQMRKIFDDRLDDLDDPLAHINPEGVEVTYRDRIHNNDWVGFLGMHITYKIYLGRKPCPAYDAKN